MITYVTYLKNDGKGQPKTKFLNLKGILDGTVASIFEAWKKTRIKYDLVQTHLVELAIHGAAFMVSMHEGFVTKLKREVLHLFRTHCIAYGKALASKDGIEAITPVASMDRLSNKVYRWIGKFFFEK